MSKIISNIRIKVIEDETNEIVHTYLPKEAKEKFSFLNKKSTNYHVCAEYINKWKQKEPIWLKFKIISDNMDEPKILEAIKTSDLDSVSGDLKTLIKKGKRIIDHQKTEIDQEDDRAIKHIEMINYFYVLIGSQILIFIGLGLYQIFAFRKLFLQLDN